MKKTVLHAAIFALTMPMSLYAIGLGNMTVKSALDQPFSAEIELIDVGSTPLPSIKVGLADPENFEQIGIERTAVLSLLSFKIDKNSQGKFVIIVESLERMTEPYMELVVDLTWPKGQLYKAYTVLLDPPGYQLVSTTAQSSPTHFRKVKTYANEPGVIEKTITTTVKHNNLDLNDSKNKTTYGPTITNENVWQIAQRYKTSEVILPQVVLAIVGANPDAFIDGNLNGLKVGVRLIIPSTAETLQVPSELATEEVMAHDKAWNDKTAINHVLSPPYMDGQIIHTSPSVKNSVLPKIPKLMVQTLSTQESVVQSQLIPVHSAISIVNNMQQKSVGNNINPQSMEQDSTTKAEISITAAAVDSVRESNALLMEQLHLLQDQNKKLQQQLDKRDKELEQIHAQMEEIMKERLAIAAQASSPTSNSSSLGYGILFLLLIMAAGGGGFAYWYFKLRKQESNESPYLSDTPIDFKPFIPLVEPVPIKGEELKTDEAPSVSEVAPEDTVKEETEQVDSSIENQVDDSSAKNNQDSKTSQDNSLDQVVDHSKSLIVQKDFTSEETIPSNDNLTTADEMPNKETPKVDELPSSDVLEFESGLHELLQDKSKSKTSGSRVKKGTNNEMGLDFTPPSSDKPDNTISPNETLANPESETKNETPNLLKSTKALNTLLNLAKTYIGMDDFDSARHSLEEVVQFGSDKQKIEANRLLEQIKDR